MANELGSFLNDLGNILAGDTAYPLDGTFLYAEADWQMVDISIFKDLGDHMLYRLPMRGLSDTLLDLWSAEVPEKRWSTLQYRIDGSKFQASFSHDPLDPNVSTIDRRQHVLQQRYGNKKIDYPPLL